MLLFFFTADFYVLSHFFCVLFFIMQISTYSYICLNKKYIDALELNMYAFFIFVHTQHLFFFLSIIAHTLSVIIFLFKFLIRLLILFYFDIFACLHTFALFIWYSFTGCTPRTILILYVAHSLLCPTLSFNFLFYFIVIF